MVQVVVNSGICGFTSNVEANSSDNRHVKLKITSNCPNYQKIAEELQEVDAYQEVFQKLHDGVVYKTFAKYSPHPSCPGLSGILKAVEVAAGLALPKNVSIEIIK